MAEGHPHDPLAGPTVTLPRALLRDACTALQRLGEDRVREQVERFAYPNDPQGFVRSTEVSGGR